MKTQLFFQELIPLTLEDFNTHIQKRSHKDKETKQQAHQSVHNVIGNHSERTTSMVLMNDANSQMNIAKSNSPDNNLIQNSHIERSSASSLDSIPGLPITHNLENGVGDGCRVKSYAAKSQYSSRTVQRIQHEAQVIDNLTRYLKAFDSTLRFKPFGSATYGFGGSDTNFNILVNTSTDYKEYVQFN